MHSASSALARAATAARRSCAWTPRAGLASGSAYDLTEGALLGRGDQADIRLEDGFASSAHARLVPQGDVMVLEDLGSTNGTYLNGEPLRGRSRCTPATDPHRRQRVPLRALTMLRIAEHWHGSDLGLQRQGNEDNYFVRAPLFVVADGMGGAQAGEVASEMAVEAFGARPARRHSPGQGLRSIIEEANRHIHERSRTQSGAPGWARRSPPRTSASTRSTIAHVGDSRCYLLRDGELKRLTDGPLARRRAASTAASSPRSRPRRTRSAP